MAEVKRETSRIIDLGSLDIEYPARGDIPRVVNTLRRGYVDFNAGLAADETGHFDSSNIKVRARVLRANYFELVDAQHGRNPLSWEEFNRLGRPSRLHVLLTATYSEDKPKMHKGDRFSTPIDITPR